VAHANYVPVLVFGGTEGVRSHFHVLRSRTRFRRYRWRRVPFSCFAHPNSFSAVPRASGPVIIFCATGVVFGGAEGVGSRFLVLAPELLFGDTEGVASCFHVFALPDSFSEVPRASGLDFLFCASELVSRGTEGVGSRFHVLRSRNHF
jgi:hypothetical protein